MLRLKSKVGCFDNTGAKLLEVIAPVKQHALNNVYLGRAFIGFVKRASLGKSVQRKQIIKGLLICTRKKHRRPDGSFIQFNQNRAILLKKATKEQLASTKAAKRWATKTEPLGTAITSAIPLELRQKRLKKLVLHAGQVY
ncbi:50S ribosomal protein L14 [Reticulomyxa filosa]|uniref:50S ribosomal protein L14 n=1 Tax=Reticulomyxa filosa TaxID=46433 RepID=X6MAV4_RETFI|nr:50S ribosomal protein L14 [Reticulomyxa filosa]|eukprot:ETO10781.1 50S ribosomal protein L14 [Reticulomyxa filosa]